MCRFLLIHQFPHTREGGMQALRFSSQNYKVSELLFQPFADGNGSWHYGFSPREVQSMYPFKLCHYATNPQVLRQLTSLGGCSRKMQFCCLSNQFALLAGNVLLDRDFQSHEVHAAEWSERCLEAWITITSR